MTAAPAVDAVLAWMWQVILHSFVCGVVFFIWTRRLGLPSGRTRRRLLVVSLALPLLTALVPGRSGLDFRASTAWFDGGRVLLLPLFRGLQVQHVVVAICLLAVLATAWQELLPMLKRHRLVDGDPPPQLLQRTRELPGWRSCRVAVTDSDEILIATDGPPWNPRTLFSRGALAKLQPDELDAVLRHEHAHRRPGRWWVVHVLFSLRLLQIFNPVALWCFREYCVEVEILCDAEAVEAGDVGPMARALLKVYETTDHKDGSVEALRKRVDLLLGRRRYETRALHPGVEAAAVAALALVLPWLV